MKTVFLSVLLVGITNLLSADMLQVLECHDKVVQDGIQNLILPKEVESLFGTSNVDHFISEFGSRGHPAIWNSVGYFNDRYMFTLQVPIAIDYGKCELTGATDSATIQINEVTKVVVGTSGIAGADMSGQWTLNENEWKWLVKNKGEWSVAKIPILTNAPVKGFDEWERQKREPIRNRKKGFDEPIRKVFEQLRKQTNAVQSK